MRLPPLPVSALPPVPAVLLAILSLQGGAAFAKTLFPLVGAPGITALRVGLSAAVLLLVFRPNLRKIAPADWRVIAPYGAILGVMNLVFYTSLNYLPLGLAVTLEFSGPLVLALFLSKRGLDVLWVALAALGIFLIMPHTGNTTLSPIGIALALTAGALWAAYIVIGGKVALRVPGLTGVVAGMTIAALIAFPIGLWQTGPKLLHPQALISGLAVAILSSAIPYALELRALRVIPAKVFGIMMSVEPAIAALCGLIILHERLTPQQWIAMLCVMVASAGINLTNKADGR